MLMEKKKKRLAAVAKKDSVEDRIQPCGTNQRRAKMNLTGSFTVFNPFLNHCEPTPDFVNYFFLEILPPQH